MAVFLFFYLYRIFSFFYIVQIVTSCEWRAKNVCCAFMIV